MRRFGFSGKRKQRRRQLIAWAFNLLILILACGWLLLNLLINPERYAGSLSVAGMTDDEAQFLCACNDTGGSNNRK